MLNALKYSALAAALMAGSGTLAFARDNHRNPPPPPVCDPPQSKNVAPEIDPGVAFGSLSMLGGTVAVLRSRRRQK